MYEIVGKRRAAVVLGVVACMVAVAGCDSNAASRIPPGGGVAESASRDGYRDKQPVLRSQVDAIRSRVWVLTPDGIALYEASTGEEVAQIPLPGWLWVGEQYACPPDLAIGPSGEAVISSNVVSRLWRIDSVTLAASEHELALDDDTGRDIGFTGLTYSAQQGAFFAISAVQGSLWRIDPRLQRAQSIPLSAPIANACDLAMRSRAPDRKANRSVGLCAGAGQGNWVINLAPDQRSGYVSEGSCLSASLAP